MLGVARPPRDRAPEAEGKDGGLRARLERAARTVAVLQGLGYAGAYIGGTHDADHVAWIIRRARELGPRWEALAEELRYGVEGGFYLYGRRRPGGRPAARATSGARLHHRAGVHRRDLRWARPGARFETPRGPDRRGGALAALDRPRARRHGTALSGDPRHRAPAGRWPAWRPGPTVALPSPAPSRAIELAVKRPLFGCQACGNCVLGHLEYVCPETCPKHLRNGPCGGTLFGQCEVVDQPCVWVGVHARAGAAGRERDLLTYVPPPDRALQGTSSWINYLLDRDSRPGS